MKKLGVVVLALVLVLSGCSEGKPTAAPVINREETAATTEATVLPTMETAAPNQNASITKNEITEEFTSSGKMMRGSSTYNGVLIFNKNGFTFVTETGDEARLPINVVLLAVVSQSGAEAAQETLDLFTQNYDYKFEVDKGFSQKISKYIIISEATATY